jgi:hypothetical protein
MKGTGKRGRQGVTGRIELPPKSARGAARQDASKKDELATKERKEHKK